MMKKNILLVLCALLCLASCSSTKNQTTQTDPNFLGDFNPFYIGEVLCQSTVNFGKLKACTLEFYFNPRANTFWVRTKVGADKIQLIIQYEEAQKIADSVIAYMNDYNEKNFTDRKPTKKNQYDSGNMYISWGVLGYSREVYGPYSANYEVKDSKPYYRLKFDGVRYPKEEDVFSPTFALYFSPTQLETLFEVTDYDEILKIIDEKNHATYDFEYEFDYDF